MALNAEQLAHLMEDWDADLVLHEVPDTQLLKARSSAMKNLRPLRTLCLKSIANNMDQLWCQDFAANWSGQEVAFLLGPFDELPGCLVTEIMGTLREMNVLHFRHLLPLVTCQLESLNLSSLKNINKVLVAIKYRCKELLRVLNVEQCKGLSMPSLKDTLASLQNLQVLNLRQTGIGDDVLATLGSNNETLRELYLCNNKISNKGLSYLCVDDGHVGKCKKLQVITLEFTGVSAEGLVIALEHLPRLSILDNNCLSLAALKWQERHPDGVLALQRMSFNFNTLNTEQLYQLVYLCPKLQELTFLPMEDVACNIELDAFLSLNNLTKVSSQNSIVPSIAWIMHLGQSLTHLSVTEAFDEKTTELDLTIIGKFCPKLVKLDLRDIMLTESDFSLNDKHFSNLQSVNLQGNEVFSFHKNLTCILNSESIKSIVLYLFNFNDEFLLTVCDEIGANNDCFKHLSDIELLFCKLVSIRGLRPLIALSPCLKRMSLMRCDSIARADIASLQRFIASTKLNVNITWT